eukprot:s1654_g1.t1
MPWHILAYLGNWKRGGSQLESAGNQPESAVRPVHQRFTRSKAAVNAIRVSQQCQDVLNRKEVTQSVTAKSPEPVPSNAGSVLSASQAPDFQSELRKEQASREALALKVQDLEARLNHALASMGQAREVIHQ